MQAAAHALRNAANGFQIAAAVAAIAGRVGERGGGDWTMRPDLAAR